MTAEVLRALPDNITPGEIRVLEIAGTTALSRKEIAARLNVCIPTVKNHLNSIYRKLGFRGTGSRVRLMKWMVAQEK